MSDKEAPKARENESGEQNEINKKPADCAVPFKEETRQDQIIIVGASALALLAAAAIFYFEIKGILR